jgi:hypothetical protein
MHPARSSSPGLVLRRSPGWSSQLHTARPVLLSQHRSDSSADVALHLLEARAALTRDSARTALGARPGKHQLGRRPARLSWSGLSTAVSACARAARAQTRASSDREHLRAASPAACSTATGAVVSSNVAQSRPESKLLSIYAGEAVPISATCSSSNIVPAFDRRGSIFHKVSQPPLALVHPAPLSSATPAPPRSPGSSNLPLTVQPAHPLLNHSKSSVFSVRPLPAAAVAPNLGSDRTASGDRPRTPQLPGGGRLEMASSIVSQARRTRTSPTRSKQQSGSAYGRLRWSSRARNELLLD